MLQNEGNGDLQKDEPSELSGMVKYWVGKDYTNFIVKDFTNLDLPYQGKVQFIHAKS